MNEYVALLIILIVAVTVPLGLAKLGAWRRRRRFKPYYQFFRLGEPTRVEYENRKVLRAPRGGIRYIEIDEDG